MPWFGGPSQPGDPATGTGQTQISQDIDDLALLIGTGPLATEPTLESVEQKVGAERPLGSGPPDGGEGLIGWMEAVHNLLLRMEVFIGGPPFTSALKVAIVQSVAQATAILDGADVNAGTTTDAVVAAGAEGTMSAKLRRLTTDIDTILSRLPVQVDGRLPVDVVRRSTNRFASGIVTATGDVLAARVNRLHFKVQNLGTTIIYLKLGTGASASDFDFILPASYLQDDGHGGVVEDAGSMYTGIVSVFGTSIRYNVLELW